MMFGLPEPAKLYIRQMHGKFIKITVVEPNPECLEFWGYVYGQDENGKIYLLDEWEVSISPRSAKETSDDLVEHLKDTLVRQGRPE